MPENDEVARSEIDKLVRELIFAHFIEDGRPPSFVTLAQRARLRVLDVLDAVHRLENPSDIVLTPGSQAIAAAHPFCGVGGGYRVTSNGCAFWVGCAWDAVFVGRVLEADVDVRVPCADCGAQVEVQMRGGRVEGDCVIHVLIPPSHTFDNVTLTCATTLFFRNESHARRWCVQRALTFGGIMRLGQALDLYCRLSMGRNRGDWYPTPRADRLSAFAQVGLTNEFWSTSRADDDDALFAKEALSRRESQILDLLVAGRVKKQIAYQLDLSFHTVDSHVRNVYAKLGAHSRAEAVAIALRARLI